MLVLGLILIALSAGALIAVVASGTDDQAALWASGTGGVMVPTLVIFLLGAATLLVFIMGLELMRSGLKRANQNRRNNRRLRKLEKREASQRDSGPVTEAATAPAGDTTPPANPSSVPPPAGGPYQSPPPAR